MSRTTAISTNVKPRYDLWRAASGPCYRGIFSPWMVGAMVLNCWHDMRRPALDGSEHSSRAMGRFSAR
jgi:hypothetical protein